MSEQPLSSEMKKLLQDIARGGLAFRRLEAIERMKRLRKSHPRLVVALLRASERDESEDVRKEAAEALGLKVHAEILEKDPGLIDQARIEKKEVLKQSVWGWISFALSIISILIIYLDIFLIGAAPTSVASGQMLDISPLFCLSFLLSVFGLVFGIIGLRQWDRVKTFSRLGALLNGLIILCTLILSMAVRFTIA